MKMRKRRIHYAPRTRWVYGSRLGAAHRVEWTDGKAEHTRLRLQGADLVPLQRYRFAMSQRNYSGIAIQYNIHRK